jgi:hypothetical protein
MGYQDDNKNSACLFLTVVRYLKVNIKSFKRYYVTEKDNIMIYLNILLVDGRIRSLIRIRTKKIRIWTRILEAQKLVLRIRILNNAYFSFLNISVQI